MNTKFIGIKEFRQNISDYATQAQKGKGRFIVMKRNKPLFEIKAFSDDVDLNTFFADIIQAKKDIKNGDVYSHDDVLKILS